MKSRRPTKLLVLGAFSACLLGTALVAPPTARAADDGDGDEAPAEPSFNFKLPDRAKVKEKDREESVIKKEDQADEAEAIGSLKVRVNFDYPRFSGSFGAAPAYFSLNQVNVAGTKNTLNTSKYTVTSFEGGLKAEFTPRVAVEANVAFARYGTAAQTIPPLAISDSTANVIKANVQGSYCFYFGLSGFKFCPTVGMGVDAFPIFVFTDATHLAIDTFSTQVLRGNGKLYYTVGQSSTLWLAGGYDYGIGKGAANAIATASAHSLWGQVGFSTPISVKWDLMLGALYDSKSSSFTQTTDTWSATASVFSMSLGVNYRF